MDTTLVSVTLLSMTMAAALSVIVWRMLRDERRRSEARVTALTAMASRPARPGSAPDRRPAVIDLPIRQAPAIASAPPLFAEPEHASPWGHRFAVMAGVALVIASAILFALTANNRKVTSQSARAADAPAAAGRTAGLGDARQGVGLELLSLRDSRQPLDGGRGGPGDTAHAGAGTLTITGLVQNPRGGTMLSRVIVTAYAFDDKGAFLASGRALIDVTSLAPGDESPFVVSVPVSETVARYRIGFRTEDGRVISHIDKRQQGPVAANW
jgi:hypothetical protein